MERIFKNKKSCILGLIATIICLTTIKLIASLIDLGTNEDGVYYFITLVDFVLIVTLAVFAILAVYKENKFWSKVLFITYFSYYLFSAIFGFSDYFMYFSIANSAFVLWGLGTILDFFAVIAIGVLYILRLKNNENLKNIEDILIYVRFGIIAFNLIMTIVLIAQSYVSWSLILQPFIQVVTTFVYVIARDFKFEEKTQIEEKTQTEEISEIEE